MKVEVRTTLDNDGKIARTGYKVTIEKNQLEIIRVLLLHHGDTIEAIEIDEVSITPVFKK